MAISIFRNPKTGLKLLRRSEVVRLIFSLYTDKGYGVHRIRQYLTENGMLARSGKPFSERGLRVMIQNETYSGRAVRKKFTNGLVFDKHTTRETGHAIIFETDKIPAIVDMETFEKAQGVLEASTAHHAKGIYTGKHSLREIDMRCCGSPYMRLEAILLNRWRQG